MDTERFDGMTKVLAAGASRRRLLRGLATGAAGGALALLGVGGAAAQPPANPGGGRGTGKGPGAGAGKGKGRTRVGVCHYDEDEGTYKYLRLPEPAARAHARHGDATNVDLGTDVANCGACGAACPPAPACNVAVCAGGACGTEAAADGAECSIDNGDGTTTTGSCAAGVCTPPAA